MDRRRKGKVVQKRKWRSKRSGALGRLRKGSRYSVIPIRAAQALRPRASTATSHPFARNSASRLSALRSIPPSSPKVGQKTRMRRPAPISSRRPCLQSSGAPPRSGALSGGVTEWLKVAVLKTARVPKALGSSNLPPSALTSAPCPAVSSLGSLTRAADARAPVGDGEGRARPAGRALATAGTEEPSAKDGSSATAMAVAQIGAGLTRETRLERADRRSWISTERHTDRARRRAEG